MEREQESQMVKNIHKKKVAGMGRRRFLNHVGGLGVGGLAATHITVNDIKAAARDQVPIVHSFTRDDPEDPASKLIPEKKMVPADWYNDLRHAEKVYESAGLERKSGVIETEIRPGKYGGRNAYIRVGIDKNKNTTAMGEIPERIDGVSIEVEEAAPAKLSCFTSDQGRTIRGGAKVTNGVGTYGSLCAPMYKNGNKYFASNEHIWHGTSSNSMYHPNDNHARIAKIIYKNCELDFVIGTPRNNHVPENRISGRDSFRVVGQFSKDGINDLIANDRVASKNGVTTCRTTGKIYTANGNIGPVDGGCWFRGHQVKGEWNQNDGDSGSPVYRQVGNGDVKILSMNAGEDPLNDNAFGFGAYWLKNRTGYHF